jgi:uncharacterized alkaline shock family protein YloU
MVKKPILLVFGGSSAIVEELLKYFKKKYQIYVFYNKNVPKKNRNIKEKIKLNLFSDKELLSKIRK